MVFPVRYELGCYIPEDGILHSHLHCNLQKLICTAETNHITICSSPTPQYGVSNQNEEYTGMNRRCQKQYMFCYLETTLRILKLEQKTPPQHSFTFTTSEGEDSESN
jgi:hypothetical protein